MINHLFCHTAVNADVLPCYESCLVRAEKQYHVRYIERVSYPATRLLNSIRALVYRIIRINPARRLGTIVYAFHQWQSVVDEVVNPSMLTYYTIRKGFKHGFIRNVTYKVVTIAFINNTDNCSIFSELLCYALAYSFCPTGYYNYFIFEYCSHSLSAQNYFSAHLLYCGQTYLPLLRVLLPIFIASFGHLLIHE